MVSFSLSFFALSFRRPQGQKQLYDILHAYACLSPSTGYCQGTKQEEEEENCSSFPSLFSSVDVHKRVHVASCLELYRHKAPAYVPVPVGL